MQVNVSGQKVLRSTPFFDYRLAGAQAQKIDDAKRLLIPIVVGNM